MYVIQDSCMRSCEVMEEHRNVVQGLQSGSTRSSDQAKPSLIFHDKQSLNQAAGKTGAAQTRPVRKVNRGVTASAASH